MRIRSKVFYGVAALAFFAAYSSALDVGVGAFYAPGRVVGYVDEVREHSDKGFSLPGFQGRVYVGIHEGLAATLGFGYNDLCYREEPIISIEEVKYVTSVPTLITTAGVLYGFPFSPVQPYVGGGAALARESAEAFGYSTTNWYGGAYAEGGARYFVTNNLAIEAGPRYTHLFDEPAVLYDALRVHDFVRSEHHTQLVELLVGVSYHF